MKQLSALDASFIFNETANAPQHIGSLSIFDPSTAPTGTVRFKQIMENMVSRAHMAPMLRERLIQVPFNADFPYWIKQESFDPEFHIRHIALPEPGDWRQLCIQVARIYARPLDRSRPLWEMYVIEGLDNVEGYPKGCFAFLSKTHHAAIDGSMSTSIASAFLDMQPIPDPAHIPAPGPWVVDKVPTDAELLAMASFNNLTQPLRFLQTISKTAPQLQSALTQVSAGKVKAPAQAPRSRFNGTVGSNRVFEGVKFKLDTIKRIKTACGGTVNDVMVAICSGALRSYLLEKNELPEASLISLCPMNLRTDTVVDGKQETGNQVAPMAVALRTDIACAKERMLAICEETRNSKEYVNAIGARTMLEYGQFTPASLAAAGAKVAAEQGLANVMDPTFNTVTTNVPGPPIPLYSNGAKLLGTYGLGIVQDYVGLFHTISSYCDEATISITCCREMMPDPAHYADLLRASLRDLEQAFLPAPDDGQVPESIPVKAKRAATATATATAKPKAKPTPAQATAKQSAVKAKQPKQVAVKAAAKPAS